MTTASGAFSALRTRLEGVGSGISVPMRFQNEDGDPLPDVPSAFAFVAFHTDRGYPAYYGSGFTARNNGSLDAYVFVPRGEGLQLAMDHAETIAARLRGFRDSSVQCFEASVRPGGSGSDINQSALGQETQSVADNYFWAMAQVSFFYDQPSG